MALNINEAVSTAAYNSGFVDTTDGQPDYIVAGMLGDVEIMGVRICELEPAGKSVVFVKYAPDKDKPDETIDALIIGTDGKERVFTDAAAAVTFAGKLNFGGEPDAPIELVRKIEHQALADPLTVAKSTYSGLVKELDATNAATAAISTKLDAATAIGWSEMPTHTAEFAAFSQLESATEALADYSTMLELKVGDLGTMLTGAGVDLSTLVKTTTTPAK